MIHSVAGGLGSNYDFFNLFRCQHPTKETVEDNCVKSNDYVFNVCLLFKHYQQGKFRLPTAIQGRLVETVAEGGISPSQLSNRSRRPKVLF